MEDYQLVLKKCKNIFNTVISSDHEQYIVFTNCENDEFVVNCTNMSDLWQICMDDQCVRSVCSAVLPEATYEKWSDSLRSGLEHERLSAVHNLVENSIELPLSIEVSSEISVTMPLTLDHVSDEDTKASTLLHCMTLLVMAYRSTNQTGMFAVNGTATTNTQHTSAVTSASSEQYVAKLVEENERLRAKNTSLESQLRSHDPQLLMSQNDAAQASTTLQSTRRRTRAKRRAVNPALDPKKRARAAKRVRPAFGAN